MISKRYDFCRNSKSSSLELLCKKNYWKLIKIQALVSKKTAVGMQFHQKETKKET